MAKVSPSKTGDLDSSIQELIKDRDAKAVANYIKSERCKNIITMAGAGISTSAGIPDFRSPETGLYANLARLKLPFPEAVFEINYFRRNPVPFYTLAHELAPGRYRPTPTHAFIRLLSEKGLLNTHFTQNIDTLERRAGVPDEDIIEAHGSFATSRCIDCKARYDSDKMRVMIDKKDIPHCGECNGLVKPDIVFFGESLPPSFFQAIPALQRADLLIVMGTSLTVHPFAALVNRVPKSCPRILINLDPAGNLGEWGNDIVLLGDCDKTVREICSELGWEEELDKLWAETEESLDEKYRPVKAEPQKEEDEAPEVEETKGHDHPPKETSTKKESDEAANPVDELVKKIEEALNLESPPEVEESPGEKKD